MKVFGLALLMMMGISQSLSAAIIFTLTPATQQVAPGGIAQFELFVRTGGGPTSTTLESLDANVIAGAGDGSSGVFLPSNTELLGSTAFDVTSTPGMAFTTNFSNTNLVLGTSDVRLGVLNLDTTGLASGFYNITMDSLSAGDPVAGAVATSGNSVQFEVTAVPEPASILSLSVVGLASGWYARRRSKIAKSSAL
jgi:hypothetical protein